MHAGWLLLLIMSAQAGHGQELFVTTEPASNMAAGSIGLRWNTRLFHMEHNGRYNSLRIEPEMMVGINKNIMVHAAGYASSMFQKQLKWEGASIYGKYRFLSQDEIHAHFRMAAFAKFSVSRNPQYLVTTEQHLLPDGNGGYVIHQQELHLPDNEIDPDGNSSAIATGLIATKLKDRMAFSATGGYTRRLDNSGYFVEAYQPRHAITWSTSAGWLLLPKNYTDYRQTNFNIYLEALGQYHPDKQSYYLDVAPAVQFIFNSIARLDLSWRKQLAGNTERLSKSAWMIRLEYNLLNVF